MFYPNDRWELSFRRKCQRSSQGGSLGWTWWVLIMLNKIDSDESICAIEAVPMSSKVCFQTGGVPGSRFPSQSESYLCLASPPPPPPWYLACFFFFFFQKTSAKASGNLTNLAPDVWKTFTDKGINPFGGQMLSKNVPATARWVSKFIRNIN